jgi:hypothetical protein
MLAHDRVPIYLGESGSEIGVILIKAKEVNDGTEEAFDVLGLSLLTASGIGFFLLGKGFRGSFCVEVGTNTLDDRCRCSNAP